MMFGPCLAVVVGELYSGGTYSCDGGGPVHRQTVNNMT